MLKPSRLQSHKVLSDTSLGQVHKRFVSEEQQQTSWYFTRLDLLDHDPFQLHRQSSQKNHVGTFFFWKKDSSKTSGGERKPSSPQRSGDVWNSEHQKSEMDYIHVLQDLLTIDLRFPGPKVQQVGSNIILWWCLDPRRSREHQQDLIEKKWTPQMLVGSLIQHSEPVIYIVRYCFCVDVLVKGPYPPLHRQMFEGAGLKRLTLLQLLDTLIPENPTWNYYWNRSKWMKIHWNDLKWRYWCSKIFVGIMVFQIPSSQGSPPMRWPELSR